MRLRMMRKMRQQRCKRWLLRQEGAPRRAPGSLAGKTATKSRRKLRRERRTQTKRDADPAPPITAAAAGERSPEETRIRRRKG